MEDPVEVMAGVTSKNPATAGLIAGVTNGRWDQAQELAVVLDGRGGASPTPETRISI